jgi:hypothetical protein
MQVAEPAVADRLVHEAVPESLDRGFEPAGQLRQTAGAVLPEQFADERRLERQEFRLAVPGGPDQGPVTGGPAGDLGHLEQVPLC